jgi:hypothetical protein
MPNETKSLIPGSFGKHALQYCTDLRRFSIMFEVEEGTLSVPIDLLSTASSGNLLSISMMLYQRAVPEVPGVAAEELDQLLARPRFGSLRSLSVLVNGYPPETLFTWEVRLRMPLANARGILE